MRWLVLLLVGCLDHESGKDSTNDTAGDDTASDDTASDDTGSDDTGSDDTGSDDTGGDDTGGDDTDTGMDGDLSSSCSCFDASELDLDYAAWSQPDNVESRLTCTADADGETGASLEAYLTFEHYAGDGSTVLHYDRDLYGVTYYPEYDRYYCRDFIYSYTLDLKTKEYSNYADEDGFYWTDLKDAQACHALVLAWMDVQGMSCDGTEY